jgi:hypothetical protein
MDDLTPTRLVGAWRYVRWDTTYDDGRVTHPYADGATGLILYTADGYMSASIMAPNRPLLTNLNPRKVDAVERAQAFDGYFSYAGRWRIENGRVIHDVEIALNPSFVGVVQAREPLFGVDREYVGTLSLSATEQTAQGRRTHRILWRRASRAELDFKHAGKFA